MQLAVVLNFFIAFSFNDWAIVQSELVSGAFKLHSVFDPSGGYFKKGGKYIPSLVAEIGEVVEQHLQEIGMLKKPGLDEHQQKLVAEKKKEFMEKQAQSGSDTNAEGFPAGAQLCKKCNTKAAIIMDGCLTCLNCGESKCG